MDRIIVENRSHMELEIYTTRITERTLHALVTKIERKLKERSVCMKLTPTRQCKNIMRPNI